MYCPHCGNPVDHEPAAEAAEVEIAEVASAEVEIERIRADKEVAIAKINARVTENVIEVEQVAELAHAEGKAEGMEEVLDAQAPEAAPGGPVIVAEPPAEPEPADAMPEPPAVHDDHSEPHEPKRSSSYGNSGWFG